MFTSSELYVLDAIANRNDSANVNNAKNIKFIGAFRRTFVQQAIDINVTNITANAIQNISGCECTHLFVGR